MCRSIVVPLFGVLLCCTLDGVNARRLEGDEEMQSRGSGESSFIKEFMLGVCVSQRSTVEQETELINKDDISAGNEGKPGSGSSTFPSDTGSLGTLEDLPPPGEVQLRFVNITSVLITWSYQFDDVPPLVQFMVQRSRDGEPYTNCSGYLSNTCYVFNGLEYAGYYQFRVSAYHLQLGLTSPVKETYYFVNGITAPPGPPSDVKATAISYDEITLQWEGPDTPTPLLYIVKWGTNFSILDLIKEVYKTTHITFPNLIPGKMYHFQIIADISGRLSIPTPIVNVSTLNLDITCYCCEPLSSTELLLKWKYLGPSLITNPHTFVVFELPLWKKIAEKMVNMSGSYTYIVQGLSPWTSYSYGITLNASMVVSSQCPVTLCRTLEDAPSKPPANITLAETTAHSITLTWLPPPAEDRNGNILSYAIAYTCCSPCVLQLCNKEEVVVPADSSTAEYMKKKFTGLLPLTECTFEIAAKTGRGGYGPFSFKLSATTEKDAPSGVPGDFLPMSVTDRSISLAWGPPHACQQNGDITGYTIYLSENYQPCYLNGLSKRNHVVNVSDREVTVESLNADTTYTLSVAARNRVGIGPCSLPLNITTMKSVVKMTIDMNFSVVISQSENPDFCFLTVFSWQKIFQTLDNSTSLTYSSSIVCSRRYHIQYSSDDGPMTTLSVAYPEAESAHYDLLHSKNAFISGANYSFWLCVEANLSNGTYLYLQSSGVHCVVPLCTHHTGGSTLSLWKASTLTLAAAASLIIIGAICLLKWFKKKGSLIPYVDDKTTPSHGKWGMYMMFSSLRVAIGDGELEKDTPLLCKEEEFPSEENGGSSLFHHDCSLSSANSQSSLPKSTIM